MTFPPNFMKISKFVNKLSLTYTNIIVRPQNRVNFCCFPAFVQGNIESTFYRRPGTCPQYMIHNHHDVIRSVSHTVDKASSSTLEKKKRPVPVCLRKQAT
jgi:hypothetical protein